MVALVALLAFALVLVLARRLRAVEERVNLFLPTSDLFGLPSTGTPIPNFSAVAADGSRVSQDDLSGPDRVLALLTTDCSSCRDQLPALRDLDAATRRPIAVVIGPPEERVDMVAALADHAVVVEEKPHGPIAEALDVHDFPAVLVVRDGYVQAAGHGVASVLAAAGSPAPS